MQNNRIITPQLSSTLLIILITYFMVSCRGSNRNDTFATNVSKNQVTIDKKDLKTIQIPSSGATRSIGNKDFSKIIDKISYIALETTDDCLIGEIYNILFDDGKIFIIDQNSAEGVFIFDKTGKYLAKIDAKGEGPEEYAQIYDVALDSSRNHVLLLDMNLQKLLTYDYTGKFIEARKLPFNFKEFKVLPDHSFAMNLSRGNGHNPAEIKNYLYATGSINDDKIFNKGLYLKTDEGTGRMEFSLPFREGFGGINYMPGLYDTLYHVSESGLKALYAFSFDKDAFPLRDSYKLNTDAFKLKLQSTNTVMPAYLHLKDYLLFKVGFANNTWKTMVYDKTEQSLSSIHWAIPHPALDFLFYQMYYYSPDTFIIPAPVSIVKKNFKSSKENKQNQKMMEELEQLSEFDNPVLFFYTLKSKGK